MDDLNPLAGTAHLLEEVDSNYYDKTKKCPKTTLFFVHFRKINGIVT